MWQPALLLGKKIQDKGKNIALKNHYLYFCHSRFCKLLLLSFIFQWLTADTAANDGFLCGWFPDSESLCSTVNMSSVARYKSQGFAPGWILICFSKDVTNRRADSHLWWGISVYTCHVETEQGLETIDFHYSFCCHIYFFTYRPESYKRTVTAWFVCCFLQIYKHSAAGMSWVFANKTVFISCFIL